MYDEVSWEDDDRADLVPERGAPHALRRLNTEDVLLVLLDEDVPLSREVQEALGGPSDDAWAAIEAGGRHRSRCRAVPRCARRPRPAQRARSRRRHDPDRSTARSSHWRSPPSTPTWTRATGPAAGSRSGTTTDAASTDAGSDLVLVLVVVVALAVGVGVVIGGPVGAGPAAVTSSTSCSR